MGLLYFAAVASVLLASALTFSALRSAGVRPGVSRRVVVSIGLGAGALILLAASNSAYALAPSPGYAVVPQSGGNKLHPPGNTGFAGSSPSVSGTSTGVNVRTTGSTVVSNGTNHIRIPIDLTTKVPRAAAIAAAKRAFGLARRLAGPAGVAFTAWEIYDWYKEAGIKTCPPPDFFCKPDVITPDPDQRIYECRGWWAFSSTSTGWDRNTTIRECQAFAEKQLYNGKPPTLLPERTVVTEQNVTFSYERGYPIGVSTLLLSRKSGAPAQDRTVSPGPALSDTEIDTAVDAYTKASVDPNGARIAKAYVATLAADQRLSDAGLESVGVAVLAPSSGVNASEVLLYASPVSTPETQVATKTTTDINGNPVNQVTTQKVTVVPKANGQGWEVKIEYPTKVEQTTTTDTVPPVIVKETTEETLQPPLPKPDDSKIEFPKDYNREATQQKILDALSTEGAPKEEDITADGELSQVEEQSKKLLDVPEGVTESSLGIKSWLPQIPVATCVNPTVNESLTGKAFEVPICGPVNVFSHLISGVMCVFCLYGCVREVQAAIKT